MKTSIIKLGALAAIAAPTVAVIYCGHRHHSEKRHNKMHGSENVIIYTSSKNYDLNHAVEKINKAFHSHIKMNGDKLKVEKEFSVLVVTQETNKKSIVHEVKFETKTDNDNIKKKAAEVQENLGIAPNQTLLLQLPKKMP